MRIHPWPALLVHLVAACSPEPRPIRLPDPQVHRSTPTAAIGAQRLHKLIELDTTPAMLARDYNHHFEIDPDGKARNTIDPDALSYGEHICTMPRGQVDELVAAFVEAGYDDLARRAGPDDSCTPWRDRGFDGWRCSPVGLQTDGGYIQLTFRHADLLVRVNDNGLHEYRHSAELRALVEHAIESDSCVDW